MKAILLIVITLIGFFVNWRYLKKALAQIAEKNKLERAGYKRALNYPMTLVWYGYLFAFFAGLTLNNLVFK